MTQFYIFIISITLYVSYSYMLLLCGLIVIMCMFYVDSLWLCFMLTYCVYVYALCYLLHMTRPQVKLPLTDESSCLDIFDKNGPNLC